MNIGILSLQGNYSEHYKKINELDLKPLNVKSKENLFKCDALIIPGGESTVITKMIYANKMDEDIIEYSKKYSIFGTCAGAIIMCSKIKDSIVKPLKIG